MKVGWDRIAFWIAILMISLRALSAAEAAMQTSKLGTSPDYSNPRATYRTYLNAVRQNDVRAAMNCWVIDDDNKSGALETIVGMWVAPRRFFQLAERTYKPEDLPVDFKKRQRDDLTDAAIDLTRRRIVDAEVKIEGDTAELRIKWEKNDGYPNTAFEFSGEPISFRRVEGKWKIDANKKAGIKRGADFFEQGTWGRAFRDQVDLMNKACDLMEMGDLKTVPEMESFFKSGFAELRRKHEEREAMLRAE